MIVVVGLVMELRYSGKSQRIVKRENTRITQEAGTAIKDAGDAIRQAGVANERAALANERTSSNEVKVADLINANLLIKNELSETTDALIDSKVLRIFRHRDEAAKRLSKFKPVRAEISHEPDDNARSVARSVFEVLTSAGWDVSIGLRNPIDSQAAPITGVIVETRSREHPSPSAYLADRLSRPEWQQITNRAAAASAVARELNNGKVLAYERVTDVGGLSRSVIFIRVGYKP